MDERPSWARRIRAEREARGWSQTGWMAVLRMHSGIELPEDAHLIRNIKRWEDSLLHQPGY